MLKRGDQIVYIPNHARNNRNHPDCEYGFVTSIGTKIAFCRYWSKAKPAELRTTANSEATMISNLQLHKSVSQKRVDDWLVKISKEG